VNKRKYNITAIDGDMVECTNLDFPKPCKLEETNRRGCITIKTEIFYIITPKNLAIQRNPFRRFYGFMVRVFTGSTFERKP
jgi:hypothetical protein